MVAVRRSKEEVMNIINSEDLHNISLEKLRQMKNNYRNKQLKKR